MTIKTLRAINNFHESETTITVDTYVTAYGERVAVMGSAPFKEWERVARECCGISGCMCHGFFLVDDDDNVYTEG